MNPENAAIKIQSTFRTFSQRSKIRVALKEALKEFNLLEKDDDLLSDFVEENNEKLYNPEHYDLFTSNMYSVSAVDIKELLRKRQRIIDEIMFVRDLIDNTG